MGMMVIGNCHQVVNLEALMKRQGRQNKLEVKILMSLKEMEAECKQEYQERINLGQEEIKTKRRREEDCLRLVRL